MIRLQGIGPGREARLYRRLQREQPVAVPGAVRLSIGIGTTAEDIAASSRPCGGRCRRSALAVPVLPRRHPLLARARSAPTPPLPFDLA